MEAGRLKFFLRQATRTINRLFDRKYLYLRGTALKPIKESLRQRPRT